VLADAVSRRLSVLVGLALTGAGHLLEGALPLFGTILLAQLLWGVGSTFESGAVDAWVTDEVGEARAAAAFMRAVQVGQVASLAGIGLATVLGRVGLAWPLLARARWCAGSSSSRCWPGPLRRSSTGCGRRGCCSTRFPWPARWGRPVSSGRSPRRPCSSASPLPRSPGAA